MAEGVEGYNLQKKMETPLSKENYKKITDSMKKLYSEGIKNPERDFLAKKTLEAFSERYNMPFNLPKTILGSKILLRNFTTCYITDFIEDSVYNWKVQDVSTTATGRIPTQDIASFLKEPTEDE